MIRKIHLAHCLKEDNWEAVRKDMNLRPVEGINGENSKEEILTILKKYGISNTEVLLWGTGTPLREFLWSEEMADASVETVGYKGKLTFDSTKPDGTMRKLTDPSKLHQLGWHHKIEIEEGVRRMYEWYLFS